MIEIRSTLREIPIRAVIFGVGGVGKSTFCSLAPGAVFIDLDGGLALVNARAPDPPKTWNEMIAMVDDLAALPVCGSIVIDSLDRAEDLCYQHVCDNYKDEKGRAHKKIDQWPYGKGHKIAQAEWRGLLARLEAAWKAGKNILLIAHTARKVVKNPTGEDYEQYQIKLNEASTACTREWVEIVAFAEEDKATVELDGRTKIQSTGKRILRPGIGSGYDSKSRYDLPVKMPLEWPIFAQAVTDGSPTAIPGLRTRLNAMIVALGRGDVESKCDEFIALRGETVASLRDAIATVQRYLDESKKKGET